MYPKIPVPGYFALFALRSSAACRSAEGSLRLKHSVKGLGWVLGLAQLVSCHSGSPASPTAAAVNVRVSQDNEFIFQEEPSIAVDGAGRLFVGWKDMDRPASANRATFASSMDGGSTWSTPRYIHRVTADRAQSDPWLLVAPTGGLIYAQTHADGITVVTSANAGVTWTAPAKVHDRGGLADKESMASDGVSSVYLSYNNVEDGTTSVVCTRSTNGRSWSPTTIIARSPGHYYLAPSIAALPDGRVYAAWWSLPGRNLEMAASRDFGATWGAIRRVNPVAGSVSDDIRGQSSYTVFPPFPAMVASSGGVVYIAWADHATGDWDVLVSRSVNDGATWSTPVRVADATVQDQWMVALALDRREVLHAAWYDSRTGDTDVRYATSPDHGATWSTSLRITTMPTSGGFNRLGDYLGLAVATNGTAHLAWTDGRGQDTDIYYARVPSAVR
jgi:hypothetical protein